MTPEAFAALGARLFLARRFYYATPQAVLAIPDDAVIAVAGAVLDADEIVRAATGAAR